MVLDPYRWAELRRFRGLLDAGVMSGSEIARVTGLDRKTVRKYLAAPGPVFPPSRVPSGRSRRRLIDPFAPLVDAMLRAGPAMKASVIHERLVKEYGFTGSYQRVKVYVCDARARIAGELGLEPGELAGMHRRFEVVPGAQAQVDWGDEGRILAHVGIAKVYSFHMTLSYSRDPFCCFTTGQDMRTFFDCHHRAFAHFGGVPMTVVYDRTKTVVRRHVAPGEAVPIHPQAAGFAGHYDFDIDVLAAHRPTGKGRVEWQVLIVRDHVLSGRSFSSLAELDAAFVSWVPLRRAQRHRTHQELIGERAARDHAALKALPPSTYVVAERCLRPVGKDCLVAFDGNLYSVPAGRVRPRQLVEVRATKSRVMLHATHPDAAGVTLLAAHARAPDHGVWVVDERHWDGLPTGQARRTTTGETRTAPRTARGPRQQVRTLKDLLNQSPAVDIEVGRRPLAVYEELTRNGPSRQPPNPQEPS
ncbi:IS21 family transposase [Streptomyces melanogenes]|uniref:IS21 family transposase n=1 Tax=Streptomyces melanogenes TaxID=67326 RepID=UPI0037B21384